MSVTSLTGNRGYGLEIVIVAQHDESFAFRGSGNDQVDRTGAAMLSSLGE